MRGRVTSRMPPLVGVGAALAAFALLGMGCAGPEDPEPIVLQVLMADDWADTRPVLDVVRRFEADNPNVTVSLVGRPFSQIDGELAASVASGDPIDVVHSHAFAAAARGQAEPLDDLWAERLDAEAFFPGAMQDVTWGDTVYGVPLDINAMFMVLDAEIVERVGVPRTPEDVRAFAEVASTDGERALSIGASAWQTYGWIRAFGGEIVEIDTDGTARFTLAREENVQALDFLAGLIHDGLAHGPTTRNVADDQVQLFGLGRTSVLTSGTWDTTTLQTVYPDRAFVTAAMPSATGDPIGGSAMGGSSLLVGVGSPTRQEAVDFILALTDDDAALDLARTEGRLPTQPALLEQAGLDPGVLDTVAAQLATATPQLLIAFPEAQDAFADAVDDVLSGRMSAAEALGIAQQLAEQAQVQ